jgi:hypothetical protein
MGDEFGSASRTDDVIRGKDFFRRMARGDAFFNPECFDETMAKLRLTPADIDATDEAIIEAKWRWNMTRTPLTATDLRKLAELNLKAIDINDVDGDLDENPDEANG